MNKFLPLHGCCQGKRSRGTSRRKLSEGRRPRGVSGSRIRTSVLAKINTSSLITTHSARNLGFIFDEHLTFSDQISALSKSCNYHIRELAVFVLILTSKLPVPWPRTSIVHSKLDYCNSLYYNLPQSQIKRFPNIQNSRSCCHQYAKIFSHHSCSEISTLAQNKERIKYKLLSLTYKILTANQPQYLHNLIFVQPCHNTRSSSMVTLARPPTRSSLKIINRTFRYVAPCLWNELPSIFGSLVRYSVLHFHLSHMAVHHHLLHHLHYRRLHLLLLVQSFILNLRLGFSAKSFPP